MKKRRNPYSIQQAVTLVFALLTIIVVGTALLIAYTFTVDEVRFAATDYITQLVSQVNYSVDQYISYMEDVSEVVRKNVGVREWAEEVDDASPVTREVLADTVINQLTGIIRTRSDISNIAVFSPLGRAVFDSRGKMLNTSSNYMETDWYTEAIERGGASYVSSSHLQDVVAGSDDWVVSVSRAITAGSGDILGVLLVDLNYSLIEDLCANVDMGKQGYLIVIDRSGSIIYHPEQDGSPHISSEAISDDIWGRDNQVTVSTDQGNFVYISNYSDVTGWTVVGVVFEDEILHNRDNIFAFYVIIVLIFLAAAAILSAIICNALTAPLRKLVAVMEDTQSGNLERQSQIDSPREAAQLSDAFNEMLLRLNQSIRQHEKDQEERRQSEFKVLQAQVNPHFLYNTLDSIIWMAENGNSDGVVEMTAALARLFRSSISEAREIVPLSVEIANIRSYLTIQKMRYLEKLSFNIDVPDHLMTAQVPKLLLQPLVENAIYHGIKPKESPGTITVEGYAEDEYLILEIADNGVGMTETQLENILQSKPTSGGIGISNVHNRIRLIFGEKYGLSYASTLGMGTAVRIILPWNFDIEK